MNRRGEVSRRIDKPAPGFFEIRLVKGGPMVAAQIQHDEATGLWSADIDGEPGAPHADPMQAEHLARVWLYGRVVTGADYRYRLALKAYALKHDPAHPAAHPREPVRVNTLSPPF